MIEIPKGFRFAGVSAGIKSRAGAKDVSLIVSDAPCVAAGVYTTNQIVAAPVVLSRVRTPSESMRGIVVNSGNANACTGSRGHDDAVEMTRVAASACGASAEQFLVMSTGVIGRFLPMDKVRHGIASASQALGSSEDFFLNAVDGIMTTDNGRKIASRSATNSVGNFNLLGMCKGAGMIGPKMATMLAIVVTDAPLDPVDAQRTLQGAANRSFNCISVEGHMSTNDSLVLLAARPTASNPALHGSDLCSFAGDLNELCIELAKKIPDDGEGATHLIEIHVRGANTDADADAIARSIALSNLVKTAITGGDPNWGRIVSAAGYAGVPIQPHRTALLLNKIPLFDKGEPLPFDPKQVSHSIRGSKLTVIELDVGLGPGRATHWTTDLNTEYVRFNSEYTT
ncbi:MAG: bifunctional glutamate N-acetyltransferase/amino-acid acetyltransferase ArgJ [Planctomycetes bacterium]|nr:bifunctional glutamate N-acetyltransferase/amino-acid acetyltransferase ArgJ [Planctomycetota bacterium]